MEDTGVSESDFERVFITQFCIEFHALFNSIFTFFKIPFYGILKAQILTTAFAFDRYIFDIHILVKLGELYSGV